MKKRPKRGDRVFLYTSEGIRKDYTVKNVSSDGTVYFLNASEQCHYRGLQGRLVPKKKPVVRTFNASWVSHNSPGCSAYIPCISPGENQLFDFLSTLSGKKTRMTVEILE